MKTKVKYLKEAEIAEVKRVSGNVTMFNINGAMHNVFGRGMSDGSDKRPLAKMLWSVSIKTKTFASVNTCNGYF